VFLELILAGYGGEADLLSCASTMISFGGIVQRVMTDTCRVDAFSCNKVASMVGLAGAMQIYAIKMDHGLMAVTTSVACASSLTKILLYRMSASVSLSTCLWYALFPVPK
jgi:uncharacterized membrane protein